MHFFFGSYDSKILFTGHFLFPIRNKFKFLDVKLFLFFYPTSICCSKHSIKISVKTFPEKIAFQCFHRARGVYLECELTTKFMCATVGTLGIYLKREAHAQTTPQLYLSSLALKHLRRLEMGRINCQSQM